MCLVEGFIAPHVLCNHSEVGGSEGSVNLCNVSPSTSVPQSEKRQQCSVFLKYTVWVKLSGQSI